MRLTRCYYCNIFWKYVGPNKGIHGEKNTLQFLFSLGKTKNRIVSSCPRNYQSCHHCRRCTTYKNFQKQKDNEEVISFADFDEMFKKPPECSPTSSTDSSSKSSETSTSSPRVIQVNQDEEEEPKSSKKKQKGSKKRRRKSTK